jgi:hypothetical protein
MLRGSVWPESCMETTSSDIVSLQRTRASSFPQSPGWLTCVNRSRLHLLLHMELRGNCALWLSMFGNLWEVLGLRTSKWKLLSWQLLDCCFCNPLFVKVVSSFLLGYDGDWFVCCQSQLILVFFSEKLQTKRQSLLLVIKRLKSWKCKSSLLTTQTLSKTKWSLLIPKNSCQSQDFRDLQLSQKAILCEKFL